MANFCLPPWEKGVSLCIYVCFLHFIFPGLDPSFAGWINNDDQFKATDGMYTEVIHTNAGLLGFIGPLADVDFYPNKGINMPGCSSQECDSSR